MPEAIAAAAVEAIFAEGFIVLTAAEIAAAAAVVQQVAFTAASLSYSAYSSKQAKRKARNAYNASLQDREQMLATATAPRRVVYGRDKVSGPIVYWESTGATKEYLHLVVPLAAHECDAIETVYFNDVALPEPDAAGDILTGEFSRTTYPVEQESLLTSPSGVITLAYPTHELIAVIAGSGVDAAPLTGYTHTPGTHVISGLPADTVVAANYTRVVPAPCVRITKHLGGPAQVANAALVAASAGRWTTAHVGKGICYLYVRLKYDIEVFGQVGLPNISAIVRGKKVFDPRSGLSAWTENAALIAADRLRDAEFGLGAASAELPESELTAAANVCEELVALDALGATQPRYTFNGSFTTDVPPQESLGDLAAAMAGNIVWSQGRWLVRPGIYRTPAPAIGPDNLARETISITPKASRSSLFNAVRVLHRDPAQAWAQVQAPLVTNPTYQAQDGGLQMVQELALPMACDTLRAQRLGKILLERSRQAMGVAISTNLSAYDLAPTDTVPLALERYGWGAGKVFEVEERTWAGGPEINYLLRETAPGIYAWNYGEATTVDLAPDTALPSPYATPAAPAGLAVASGVAHTITLSDGTVLSRALATWAASPDAFVQDHGSTEVQWRQADATTWQPAEPLPGSATAVYISPVPDGRLIYVRSRFVNSAGRSSEWKYIAHQVEVRPNQLPLALFEWVPGTTETQGTAPRRHVALSDPGENSIIMGAGPDGQLQPVWRCISNDDDTGPDGGWNTDGFPINPAQMYRFEQWVLCTGEMTGAAYLGCGESTVRDIGGGVNTNPYFAVVNRSTLVAGRWYLFVGYVMPASYAGAQPGKGGVWDGVTGEKIATGTDFQWLTGQATTWQRAFQFYATAGAVQWFSKPVVRSITGGEPDIATLLSAAALGRATQAIANAAAALAAADAAQATADGKIDTYWQATAPATASEGDIWFKTDDGAKQHRYTSGSWVVAADTRIGQAISDAADAQATADGKVVTFVQDATPTAEGVGDLWFRPADGYKLARWSGSAWVAWQIDTGAITPGAATAVYSSTVTGSQSVSAAIDQGHATYALPLPGVACSITITASMNLNATGGTIRGCSVVAAIRVSDTGTNANRDVGAQLRGPIAGVSQSVGGSLTLTRTVDYLPAQGARTVWLDCQMQGVTPSGGANCTVQDIHLRVEVIKL